MLVKKLLNLIVIIYLTSGFVIIYSICGFNSKKNIGENLFICKCANIDIRKELNNISY
jgi:hypothetical protein